MQKPYLDTLFYYKIALNLKSSWFVKKKIANYFQRSRTTPLTNNLFKGEKKFKIDELLPMISQLKKEVKNQGCYDDFLECLKLYDKEENGMMPVGDLAHSLLSMGKFWLLL